MSSILIKANPIGVGPVPGNSCILFRLGIDGEVDQVAEAAQSVVTFENGESWLSGESFIYAGIKITTGTEDWELDLSSNDAETNADAFKAFIESHPQFAGKVSVQKTVIDPTTSSVAVTWLRQGIIEDFTFDVSDITPTISLVNVNGIPDTFKDGWVLIYQLFRENPSEPVTNIQKIEPIYDSSGNVTDIDIDLRYAVNRLLKTSIPPMSLTNIVEDTTIGGRFILKYGYRFMDGCEARFSMFEDSFPFWVSNGSVSDYEGEEQYDNYRYNGINEGDIKFATSRPLNLNICAGTKDWFWLHLNLDDFVPGISDVAVRYVFYDKNGVAFRVHNEPIVQPYKNGTYILPASINQVNDLTSSSINSSMVCYYTIRVVVITDSADTFFYTQEYRFNYSSNCCSNHDFYFLDYPGGYTRLSAEKLNESNVEQSYTEVCRDVPCNDFENKLLSNNFIVNTNSTKRIVYEAKFKPNTEIDNYISSFRASESKLQIFTASDGEKYLKRVVIESGSIRSFVRDEMLVLNFTVIEDVSKILGE